MTVSEGPASDQEALTSSSGVDETALEEQQEGGHGTKKVLKVEIEMSIDIWKQTIKTRIQVIKHIKPPDEID